MSIPVRNIVAKVTKDNKRTCYFEESALMESEEVFWDRLKALVERGFTVTIHLATN